MRSTDNIGKKSTGLVYLHLFIHLASILTYRPFLSPRPLSEDVIRLDAMTDISQPTHSSHTIRRYRTLAFRIARASALQITTLARYIPLSSPCATTPYLIYTACTILLLAPDDTAAMDGVRTGVACLESIHETGYWMRSVEDAKERILALARRWEVNIWQGKKVRRPVTKGRGGRGGGGPGGPSTGERDVVGWGSGPDVESDGVGLGDMHGSAQVFRASSGETRSISGSGNRIGSVGTTQPSASTVTYGGEAEFGATYDHRLSDWTHQYGGDPLAQMYVDQEYSEDAVPVSNYSCTAPLPQENDNAAAPDTHRPSVVQDYGGHGQTGHPYTDASRLVYADELVDGQTYAPQEQAHTSTQPVRYETQVHGVHDNHSIRLRSGFVNYEHQVQPREGLFSMTPQQVYPQQSQHQQHYHQPLSQQQQQTQYRPQAQYRLQQSRAHLPTQHYHMPALPVPLPHVAYALSHAHPQHDSDLPHAHWHQVPPPANPNFPFLHEPVACADLAGRFVDTVQMAQEEPAFLKAMEDPYASVAVDWLMDMGSSFPAITMDTYVGSVGVSSMGVATVGGSDAGRSYGHGHPAYGYGGAGYMGDSVGQGM
ncbi:hypothetical protein BDV93DRAFT_250790 [Ceratobasidium sp. AG-I]|nr:hypothetical protein BDV93DRAFT_250790 [Ceratobasidium sp. AG-I]